jgi:solute carrier family 25 ornithine transporter 2/15
MRDEGFLGFFRGLTSTFAREMPGYFFFFGGYELSRHLLTPPGKTKDDIGIYKILLGFLKRVNIFLSFKKYFYPY